MIRVNIPMRLKVVFLLLSTTTMSAQSDSIVVSVLRTKLIVEEDIAQILNDYKLEGDSIWRIRDRSGNILAEGGFVENFDIEIDDIILVKHGIHNYYSTRGKFVRRETYLWGKLINVMKHKRK